MKCARAGSAGSSFDNSHRADAVLVLPDINTRGNEWLRTLEVDQDDTAPLGSPLPACMMTAYRNAEHQARAREYGSDGFLTKPVDFDERRGRIKGLVSRV